MFLEVDERIRNRFGTSFLEVRVVAIKNKNVLNKTRFGTLATVVSEYRNISIKGRLLNF